MPVYLRMFYYKKLIETKQEETKNAKKMQKKSQVHRPDINNPRFKR